MNLLVLVLLACGASANMYAPHVYPRVGPFFEGWYIRMMDHNTGESYAALFGQVLPADPAKAKRNTLITILKTEGNGKLQSYDVFPEDSTVKVTVNSGQPVTKDPDTMTPPDFAWCADPYGCTAVKPDYAVINFTLGDISLFASIGKPKAWMYSGEFGPEGWLSFLPLPLAWFVYSTASPTTYHFQDRARNIDIKGEATAHMEKNWGKAFPESWIWTEGHRTDDVTFAMSGGPLAMGPLNVMGHLAGYENKAKNVVVNFRPDNSIMKLQFDECNGKLMVNITGLLHAFEMVIQAPTNTFSPSLYGPSVTGFRMMCEESFQATAHIKILKRKLLRWEVIDEQVLEHSALEFGGNYMCAPYYYKE